MNRLETIKSMVSKCETAADIGTDHGYVAEMLLNDGTAERVIATDLNIGPLNSAREHLTSKNLNEMCDFRLGSGLTVLGEKEADAIIIAGMGGDLIKSILETSKDTAVNASQLILQPMTAIDKLRKYLYENGFIIIDEKISKEFHHYYFIIKAQAGIPEKVDEFHYGISKSLVDKNDPLMIEYLKKVLEINKNIISSLEKANNQDYNEKVLKLKEKNKKIMGVLKLETEFCDKTSE
jgi:tRNA (adenine22-N1)-methyltransferase